MKIILALLSVTLLTGCSFSQYQRGDVKVLSAHFFRNSEVGKVQAEDTRGTNGIVTYKLTIGGMKSQTEAEALGTTLGAALKAAK